MRKQKRKHRNHLYSLRRHRSYRQKHVAHLLGHKDIQMVCRYETGSSLPTLKTALLMQVIFGTEISHMYPDLYKELQAVAVRRAQELDRALGAHIRGRVLRKD
jgi:DNA-binding XRE family transcriptional regulator